MRTPRSAVLALAGLLLPMVVLAAGMFPDVGDDHVFKAEIESLARAGVVKGNPDGKYYPDKNIDRASFLTLLYRAVGRTPKAIYVGCFADVERGSWYEAVVCDAASRENGFVQGYGDNKFRPGNPVSRTEALKMTLMVFGLSVPDISEADKNLIKFVDISVSAWYSKHIVAAYFNSILPIATHVGVRFYPEKELLRGEAAAYIYNALKALENQKQQASSSARSMSSRAASSASSAQDDVLHVVFPFSDSGKFTGKKSISYTFELKQSTVVAIDVLTIGAIPSDVSCRLYLLGSDGFSSEYYLGVQTTNSCDLNVAVRPGTYQLQIQPTVADIGYSVDAKAGVTDGNDGFKDALTLTRDNAKTAVLDSGDLYDWYTFSVTSETAVIVDVTPSLDLTCIIYTPPTVDQFGFTGPQCGTPYSFVPGETYTVGVGRKADLSKKITYTIRWR